MIKYMNKKKSKEFLDFFLFIVPRYRIINTFLSLKLGLTICKL